MLRIHPTKPQLAVIFFLLAVGASMAHCRVVIALYVLVWFGSFWYNTTLNELLMFGMVWSDMAWYGVAAQGGSKFHLITTQASAQPI